MFLKETGAKAKTFKNTHLEIYVILKFFDAENNVFPIEKYHLQTFTNWKLRHFNNFKRKRFNRKLIYITMYIFYLSIIINRLFVPVWGYK